VDVTGSFLRRDLDVCDGLLGLVYDCERAGLDLVPNDVALQPVECRHASYAFLPQFDGGESVGRRQTLAASQSGCDGQRFGPGY